MKNITYLLVALLGLVHISESYKILVMFPVPSRSHHNLATGVVRALLDAGHEVRSVGKISNGKPLTDFRGMSISRLLAAEMMMEKSASKDVVGVVEARLGYSPQREDFPQDGFHAWVTAAPKISVGLRINSSVISKPDYRYLLKPVTQVTPYPDKDLPPNLKQVDVSENDTETALMMGQLNVTRFLNGEVSLDLKLFFSGLNVANRVVLTNSNIQKLLSDTTQNFDVIIAEWAVSDSYIGLSAVFDCPFIWFSTIEPHTVILNLIDENSNPAYVPNGQSSIMPPFNFIERVKELFLQLSYNVNDLFYFNNYYNQLFEELVLPHIIKRGRPAITFDDVKYNASLVLGNSHVSLGLPVRLPQAYKAIGGYHIDPEVKALPKDLKTLLDNSKDGLIYFSMGSILKSKDLPEQLKKDFLEVLGSLKQTVIWKFEEVLPNLPPNVHIVNWAPQPSILAHPNCILFITHGGLLSTTEAVHFGKAIVGIPVFGDQFHNIDRAVKKGFALRVDLAYDMKDKFKATIEEAIQNNGYSVKAKELSNIYHDRPVPPRKELVHWVEHVIKTKGAPHLRSPALGVPVYQKLYLDLLALLLAVLYALKMIVVKICCSKKTVDKKKKNL